MIKKLSSFPKTYYFVFLAVVIAICSIVIPTLGRYRNRAVISDMAPWDGSVATSYRSGSGTEEDPYVICNGSELAYFAMMLTTEDYQNTYFKLGHDILINDGIFQYDREHGMQYIENDQTYYIKEYSNELYMNSSRSGNTEKTIQFFPTLNHFKGTFDGDSYTIYGLYLTSEEDEVGLFTNLEGNVHDLYVSNSLVYGGKVTGGIASSATSSTLQNLVYDGFVVGGGKKSLSSTVSLENQKVTLLADENTTHISLLSTVPSVEGVVTSVKLRGTCTSNLNDVSISLFGQDISCSEDSFEIEIGDRIQKEMEIQSTHQEELELSFSHLEYVISYQDSVQGGIVGIAKDSQLRNVINKSTVVSSSTGAGLVGRSVDNFQLKYAYNVGSVDSSFVASGILGDVQGSGTAQISQVYHAGTVQGKTSAGLVASIVSYSGEVLIKDTFQASLTSYAIHTIEDSMVKVTSSYHSSATSIFSGKSEGNFVTASSQQLKNKNFLMNNLHFEEFTSASDYEKNPSQVWIFEEEAYPALFVDDIYDELASLHVSAYSWSHLGFDLTPYYFSSRISFSIEEIHALKPVQSISYYIHPSQDALTKDQIKNIEDWIPYEDIVSIQEDGTYIIYAKIVDYHDSVSYLNTDLLVLDSTPANAQIQLEDQTWQDLRDSLDYTYVDDGVAFQITAEDTLSNVESISYFVSDHLLEEENLNDLEWVDYQGAVSLENRGTYVIYAKVLDRSHNIRYVCSDYIVFGGYENVGMYLGRTINNPVTELTMTPHSTVSFQFTYHDANGYQEGYTHHFISTVELPLKTKITLLDRSSKKMYSYQIQESSESVCLKDSVCVYDYPLTRFKEVGRDGDDFFFKESEYSGEIHENFLVTLDFSKTSGQDLNHVEVALQLHNSLNKVVRSTLKSSLSSFTLSSSHTPHPTIKSSYQGDGVVLSGDSTTMIPLEVGMDDSIVDTSYENQTLGISLQLVDQNNQVVPKEYYKNIQIQVGDKFYSPSSDGIVRISLENGLSTSYTSLTLTTTAGISLPEKDGNYTLKITSYAAYDGLYGNQFSSPISIPVLTSEDASTSKTAKFEVVSSNHSTFYRKDGTVKMSFDFIQSALSNGNIRVSLYRKNSYTAYDQSYTLIDLGTVSKNLERSFGNIYSVLKHTASKNHAEFDLDVSLLEAGGYQFVFDLYDGNQKVASFTKKWIVR